MEIFLANQTALVEKEIYSKLLTFFIATPFACAVQKQNLSEWDAQSERNGIEACRVN
jgi:hypothetical protein